MSDVDVFVIDDDFDPLADLSLDDGERDDAEADYLPPIPDADKSVVPPVVPLSATERGADQRRRALSAHLPARA